MVARDLSVEVTTASPPNALRQFALRDDGVDTTVGCSISGASATCNSGSATATIAPGSELSLRVEANCTDGGIGGSGGFQCPAVTDVRFGWRATTP
jgi:hypothetical protein